MKKNIGVFLSLALVAFAGNTHAQKSTSIKGEEVTYMSDGTTMKGYVAYDEKQTGKRPAILVIPEWWGNTEYPRMRARMLAELGYIAIAVGMYGNGQLGTTPEEAGKLATPFYQEPSLGQKRIEAAMNKIKEYPQADSTKLAAIGYCFGGSMALNAAKIGMDFKGVVSFHGGLATVPATAGTTKANILVCHGGADNFISPEELKTFRQNLDEMKVPYSFIVYEGATHAFSNPAATET